MESNHEKKIEAKKNLSGKEGVDSFIKQKKTERDTQGREAVMQNAQAFQNEVADVMGGVEAPSEGISEKKGESGERHDITSSKKGNQDPKTQARQAFKARRALPSEAIMIKKIRIAIASQIKEEIKKAKGFQKNLTTGSAQDYNDSIAKIRRLQEVLYSLISGAVDKIKAIYFRFFTEDGRRKREDD